MLQTGRKPTNNVLIKYRGHLYGKRADRGEGTEVPSVDIVLWRGVNHPGQCRIEQPSNRDHETLESMAMARDRGCSYCQSRSTPGELRP